MKDSEALGLLRSLVEIHSGAESPRGIERVQEIIERELKKLGFQTERVEARNPKHRGAPWFLVGTYFGAESAAVPQARLKKGPFITLVTHSDTVEPGSGERSRFELSADGKRAMGCGVIDDKGGQVVALRGLQQFLASGSALRYPIRFISSPSEERGSPEFQDLLKELSKTSLMVLGFEPSFENGSIIDARRGNRWYHIQVEGREAHSGRAHAEGVNAAHELAIKIAELHRLTSYAQDVTVSVGSLSGGTGVYNTVCGHAEAKLDTRFSSFKSRDQLHRKIAKILGKVNVRSANGRISSKTRFEVVDDCPPFESSPGSRKLSQYYAKTVRRIEKRAIRSVRSGGGSDACYMSRPGLIILDGLGPTGGGMHRPDEWLAVDSLRTRAEALAELLAFVHAPVPSSKRQR